MLWIHVRLDTNTGSGYSFFIFYSVNPVGDSLIATWSISDCDWDSEAPYPGLQIDEDVFSEYIGVQLNQSEYLIPTIGHGFPGAGIQLFFAIPVITLLALLVVWYRLVK
jgi:hypothetical protein